MRGVKHFLNAFDPVNSIDKIGVFCTLIHHLGLLELKRYIEREEPTVMTLTRLNVSISADFVSRQMIKCGHTYNSE